MASLIKSTFEHGVTSRDAACASNFVLIHFYDLQVLNRKQEKNDDTYTYFRKTELPVTKHEYVSHTLF